MMAAMMVVTGVTGCGSNSSSTGTKDNTSGTQDTAGNATNTQKEDLKGSMTLYTSQPEEDAQKLIDGFNEEYPDVKVDVFRSGTEEVVSKVLAEKQADSVLADVLLVADSVTFESLKEQDLLMSYESPELKGIPDEFIDPDHMYTGTKVISTGIIYNTDMIKTAPTGFADLTTEAYKDNTIMPSPLYSGAAAYNLGVMTRSSDLGWDYYTKLKDNGVKVDKGNGAIQEAVVSGEKAAGIIVDYMAVRSKQEGSPVDFVYPSEGSPCITEPIGIVKGTKNEKIAEAFVDYVLSDKGQELASSLGYTPIKDGIAAPEGLKSISELKTMSSDISDLYKSRESDKEKFSSMFQ